MLLHNTQKEKLLTSIWMDIKAQLMLMYLITLKKILPFDQLIWEFGTDKNPDWVHVSYKKGGPQRGQILRAVRNSTGKTIYENWK
jgi:hypothetical protein